MNELRNYEKRQVTVHFGNEAAASHFVGWLSGQGEQEYWLWMECREEEESGPITAVQFVYKDPRNIIAETGRLDCPDD